MRIATILALTLLLLPVSLLGQAPVVSVTQWQSDELWGSDRQTFEAKFHVRHVQATFTVAANGFGWHQTFTNQNPVFSRWENVTAWCRGPGTVMFLTEQYARTPLGIHDLTPEDLGAIVDDYFQVHVPEVEVAGEGQECTSAGLLRPGPDPADVARIIDLIEEASPDNR